MQVSDSYQHVSENQTHDAVAWDVATNNEVGLSVPRDSAREEDEDEGGVEERLAEEEVGRSWFRHMVRLTSSVVRLSFFLCHCSR